jgi:hypothetical protein
MCFTQPELVSVTEAAIAIACLNFAVKRKPPTPNGVVGRVRRNGGK